MSNADWINREEYPFESHHFEVAAGSLHYVDEGSGPVVVMVHGNPTWSFLYRKLIKRLRAEHRCIAIDHLGFGLSDKPKDWSYRPEDHAANLAALIEGLGLKGIALVVQDWGGPIGLSYAVAHPENVARIIILNTWAWPVNRDPYYIAFREKELKRWQCTFPEARSIRLRSVGRYLQEEAPDELAAAVVPFLRETAPA